MLFQIYESCGCFKSDASASDGLGVLEQFRSCNSGNVNEEAEWEKYSSRCKLKNLPNPTFNFCPFLTSPLHPPLPLLMFTFSLEAEPRQGRQPQEVCCTSTTGCLSHLSPSSSHKTQLPPCPLASSPSPSTSCWLHQVDAKCSSGWETKLGVGVGPPWQFLNTTCSTLLQPTLRNQRAAIAALNGHTRRHLQQLTESTTTANSFCLTPCLRLHKGESNHLAWTAHKSHHYWAKLALLTSAISWAWKLF